MKKTDLTKAEQIISLLKSKGMTLSVAESCTGGLVSASLVDVAGASDVYKAGMVTYSNEEKERELGVSHNTLDIFGAVSEECAREMAAGASVMSHTDASVATTGIAGPGGGTKTKPVGLVYICAAVLGHMTVKELHLSGSREEIRRETTDLALDLLLETITNTIK